MLLAFNLPSNIPFYIVIIGALVAIGIGKMTFGGLGKNPFNPALVGRVFLFLSFPTNVAMSEWPKANPLFGGEKIVDALTGPTPLSMIKNGESLDLINMFIGSTGGSFGEVSAIAIILGGLFMLLRKVISWHIPVAFIGSAWLFAGILYLAGITVDPTTHILAGGLMLGAIFMATDMTTSPITKTGQIVFGVGCGLLTIIFRCFGPMPEGVSFAILIMNAVTPLINKICKPKKFGY
jgi:electron transport complex protein RnfD